MLFPQLKYKPRKFTNRNLFFSAEMRQPLLFRAYPRTGMRTDEEYRSLSADLFSGVGFPLFCNGRLWHNGVSCCFVMKELAVTNFCFFATGGCAVTVYFCCLASGSFSVQIFLAVLPGDIYLWVFLFRNKRFFATTFSVYNGRFLPPRFLTVLSRTVLPLRFFAAVP